jgi:hypothetical protein
LLDRGYGRPVQGVVVADMPKLPPIQHVTKEMTAEQAAKLYEQTIRGHYDGAQDLRLIDVTPEPEGGQGRGGAKTSVS